MVRGKNIIVTGANRGIGKAVVETLAEHGANVWACSRTVSEQYKENCRELSIKFGVDIWPIELDLTREGQIKEAYKLIRKQKISIDGLANVAGIVDNSTYMMMGMEGQKNVFDINYFALISFSQYVLRSMCSQKRGSIVNVASSGALFCNSGRTSYNASKAAVIASSKTLAREVGDYNIRVNSVAPGLTRTEMGLSSPEEIINHELAKSCLHRIAEPEEIANVIMFLLSDYSSFITGQTISCDGGL